MPIIQRGPMHRVRGMMRSYGVDRYFLQKLVSRKEATVPYLFGLLLTYLCAALAVPLVSAIWYEDAIEPWLYPMILTGIVGIPLVMRYKAAQSTRAAEAILILTTGWLVAMAVGSLPYMLYGMNALDAMFEAMSGFTTTGATIMVDIESWPNSLLLWRSFTQWLGGAGIVLIFVTILPMLGVSGRSMVRGDGGGTETMNVTGRVQAEAMKFHYIYFGLSAIQLILLLVTGIGLFDASTVMFSTMSTGGFSPHSQSIAYFNSMWVEWIIIAFMFLAGTNFYLHFQAAAAGEPKAYWRNSEFRAYVPLVLGATAVGMALLYDEFGGGLESVLRASAFQMLSVMTSTGFSTVDYSLWSKGILFLLFALMLIGGSSGSTAGGLKIFRFILSWKFIAASIHKTVHPKAIFSIKVDGRIMGESIVSSLMAVVICYMGTIGLTTVALVLMGMEPMTSLSAAIGTVSNSGIGLHELGPMGSFESVPWPGKMVIMFSMWAGRMEFLTVFAILTPAFWRELLRYRIRDDSLRSAAARGRKRI